MTGTEEEDSCLDGKKGRDEEVKEDKEGKKSRREEGREEEQKERMEEKLRWRTAA